MGKARKQTAVWLVFLQGTALALGVYLLTLAVLAALTMQAVLPESAVFPAVAVCCGASALTGGVVCGRRSPWGALPSGLLAAAAFAAVLVLVGLLCWEEGVTWTGHGGVLLLCALAGGCLSGLAGGRPGRRVRRKSRRK